MKRWLIGALAAFAVAACASIPGPVSFESEGNCSGAAQSPVCAAKTYFICVGYADENLCDKVGGAMFARNRSVRKNIPPLEAEPWRLTWQQIADRRHLCGLHVAAVQAVSKNRFNADPPVPETLKGTHELVMVIDGSCEKSGGYDVSSMFMKKTPGGWAVVSLDDWSVLDPSNPLSVQGSVCLSEKYGKGNGYCADFHAAGIARYKPEEIMKQKWKTNGAGPVAQSSKALDSLSLLSTSAGQASNTPFVLKAATALSAPATSMSFQDYLDEAMKSPGRTIKEYPDFTLIVGNNGLIYYFFTKPNHPAYPGVIVRQLVHNSRGGTDMQTQGHAFASDDAQPAFKAWMEQFTGPGSK